MYEQSHRDYLRSGYLHHRLPVTVVNHYRDNAIAYKAQRDKNARELSWRTRQLLTCRCVSVMLLRSMQNTRLLMPKAENDTLRDDVAAGRRQFAHQSSLSVVRIEATTASGVDNTASPRLADTAEQDYFTLRES